MSVTFKITKAIAGHILSLRDGWGNSNSTLILSAASGHERVSKYLDQYFVRNAISISQGKGLKASTPIRGMIEAHDKLETEGAVLKIRLFDVNF
jgi:hypothetical protein